MIRSLTVAALGLALAGCVQMQVNNAQVFADLAAQIAANCPAAADEAKKAQDAATEASSQATTMAQCSESARTLQAQADYWAEQAAMHEARAEAERGEALRLRESREAREAALTELEDACQNAADRCFGIGAITPDIYVNCEQSMRTCGCSDQQSCAVAERRAEESLKLEMDSLYRQIDAAEQAARDSDWLAAYAQAEVEGWDGPDENSGFADRARAQRECASNAATALSEAERAAQTAAEEAAKACDVSLFGNAPPPDGTYPQDIYGAQNRGAGGSCSPGMAATCAGVQVQCIASCGPGGVGGCSPGAPTICPACFAAGCI